MSPRDPAQERAPAGGFFVWAAPPPCSRGGAFIRLPRSIGSGNPVPGSQVYSRPRSIARAFRALLGVSLTAWMVRAFTRKARS